MNVSTRRMAGASDEQILRPFDKIDLTRLCHLRQRLLIARQIHQIKALLAGMRALEGPAAGREIMPRVNACDADGVIAVDFLSEGDGCDAALN